MKQKIRSKHLPTVKVKYLIHQNIASSHQWFQLISLFKITMMVILLDMIIRERASTMKSKALIGSRNQRDSGLWKISCRLIKLLRRAQMIWKRVLLLKISVFKSSKIEIVLAIKINKIIFNLFKIQIFKN